MTDEMQIYERPQAGYLSPVERQWRWKISADEDIPPLQTAGEMPPTPQAETAIRRLTDRLLAAFHASFGTAASSVMVRPAVVVVFASEPSGHSAATAGDDGSTDFLQSVYDLSQGGRIDAAIDKVIDRFERLLAAGDWLACQRILARAEPAMMDDATALSLLSMTFVERQRMQLDRRVFYRRLQKHLEAEHGAEEARQLLWGLE